MTNSSKNQEDVKSSFEAVLQSNEDAILITDKEGLVLFVNSAAEELFNMDKKSFVGHHFGSPVTCGQAMEITTIRKGGGVRTSVVTALELLWDEKPASLLIFHDNTQQKKSEENLKKRDEKIKGLKKRINEFEAKIKSS